MKPNASARARIVIGVFALCQGIVVRAVDPIQEVVLDPLRVTKVHVAADRITTIRFPSPVSDLEGAYFSPEPEPPALFQISFKPGHEYFTVRALATNARAVLSVAWRGDSYVLDLQESSDPVLALLFREKPSTEELRPSPGVTPARLDTMIQILEHHAEVKAQHPERLEGAQYRRIGRQLLRPDHVIVIEEVLRFDSEDVVVIRATLVNHSPEPLYYRPRSLVVGIGTSRLAPAAQSATGEVAGCGSEVILLALVGEHQTTPAGVSIRNEFEVHFDRIGKVPSSRCPSFKSEKPKTTPVRSPKDASLHPTP
jgi:hypothetical protein